MVSASAALFAAMVTFPGVADDPPTVSQGTEDEAANVSDWELEEEATGMVTGNGADVTPAMMARDALAWESTRLVVGGWIVPVIFKLVVAGMVSESLTTRVNAKLSGMEGMPPMVAPVSERPNGRDPETLKI